MIYVLIAGTYAPLWPRPPGGVGALTVLAAVSGGATAGVVVKADDIQRLVGVSDALDIIVGWAVIVAAPALVVSIPASGLALMVSGGIAYAVGAIVFLRGRPIRDPTCSASTRSGRLHHRGAVSHFAMVWLVVAWAAHPPPP